MSKRKYIFPLLLLFLLGFFLGSFVKREHLIHKDRPYNNIMMEKIKKIDTILEKEYLFSGNMDHNHMIEQALSAYVEQKEDPYISYFSAKTNSGFLFSLKGQQSFAGIGAVVKKKGSYILVEEVLKKSPSAKAGLMPLDHILKINNEYVKPMDITTAVKKLKGPVGTNVNLLIYRESGKGKNLELKDGKTFEITITRDNINLPSVYTKILSGTNNESILYIQLILIGEETNTLLKQELASLDASTIDGIIIDVRGNGGGYMPVAVDIISHFVADGILVSSAQYRSYPEEKYYSSNTGKSFLGKKMVVLVDQFTASAGEIIALCLQELTDAILVGTQTFGKGTVQTLYEFSDHSSLKYTIGKRYSSRGRTIDHEGIVPNISLEFDTKNFINSDGKKDNQLKKAIDILSL